MWLASEEFGPRLLAVASGRATQSLRLAANAASSAQEPTERTEEIHQFSISTQVRSTCQRDGELKGRLLIGA